MSREESQQETLHHCEMAMSWGKMLLGETLQADIAGGHITAGAMMHCEMLQGETATLQGERT